jgi:hypothetical protein
MTQNERLIIGYLLEKNTKTFTADSDGGHATTLIARGIVKIAGVVGQHITMTDVPMIIPDHYWDVLVQHKDSFPYVPLSEGYERYRTVENFWMVICL